MPNNIRDTKYYDFGDNKTEQSAKSLLGQNKERKLIYERRICKIASATVDIKVADTDYNTSNIIKAIEDAAQNDIKLIVFPELCITDILAVICFCRKY